MANTQFEKRCGAYQSILKSMRTNSILPLLFLLIITIEGCKERLNEEKEVILKEYGKSEFIDEINIVQLDLKKFKNFKQLLDRTEEIACSGGVPQITVEGENHLKAINLHNPCWENYACILIYENNTFRLHNDSIYKAGEVYPIDKLDFVLRKDIENNGEDSKYSDSPKKLLFLISYDNNGMETLPNTLNVLTESYEMITKTADIVIWLDEILNTSPSKTLIDSIDADTKY